MEKKIAKLVVKSHRHEIKRMKLSVLKPAPYNPRTITQEAFSGLTESVKRFGNVQPIVFNKRSGFVVGGHQRIEALRAIGEIETDVVTVDLSDEDERALNVSLNNPHIMGEFNNDQLVSLLSQIQSDMPIDFDALQLNKLLEELALPSGAEARATLAERFGVPPFSVLDARQGPWQDRKRAWIALGIKSEEGRGENLLSLSAAGNLQQKGKAYR